MKTIRHRLRDIDPILYPLNDDGASGTTIIIHGAAPGLDFLERPNVEELACLISEAQHAGKVYLLSWRSGYSVLKTLVRREYHEVEENAHRLGHSLHALLSKLPSIRKEKLRLIGHSLGAHVIVSALLAEDWKDFKVEDVVLLGTALADDDFESHSPRQVWRRCLGQIRGHIFNCYSRYDHALRLRRIIRRGDTESIGRNKASHAARRIEDISFTGRLVDDYGHSYLYDFGWVLSKVYPQRARSNAYPIRAFCDCPNCEKTLKVTADTEETCEECGFDFTYRSSTFTSDWTQNLQLMWCPHCKGETGILIQQSDSYQCPDCRRFVTFERSGGKFSWE